MVAIGDGDNQISLRRDGRARYCDEASVRLSRKCVNDGFDLSAASYAVDEYIDPKRTSGSRDQRQKSGRTWRD